MMMLQIVIRS